MTWVMQNLTCFHLETVSVSVQDRCMVCANLDAKLVHGSRLTYHRLRNNFGRTGCNPLVMWVMWNLTSFSLEIVLVSVQDRCMVCAKCTIGSEIILDAPDGTPKCRGSSESSF